ncbi:MAG TPA: cation diffusion facilitator family transporter [Candidatus Limnocylindrales bacterium]|nr:cation diffusion facilitator family transporter [Candidatus Limnocylindrales bacterium]
MERESEAHDHPHPHPHDAAHARQHDPGREGAASASAASGPSSENPGEHGHEHDEHGHEHGEHGHEHGEHGHEHETGLRGFLVGLIRPHSHDTADQIDTALESSAKGIRATKISLAILFATALIQLGLVYVTNSVALLADTIHNFGDALTSIPLWIAFVVGRRAATRRFTFGFRRAEDLAGLFIVLMIGLSAIWVVLESIDRLFNPVEVGYLPIVIGAGVVGFLGNEAIALYRIRIGREIQSAALIADGYHARTDGVTSLGVVVGAIGVALGFPQADPLMGLVIAAMIVIILVGAIRQVFGRLMDAVDPALVESVERVAARVPGVQETEAVRVRWTGHRLEATLHVVVDCEMTVAAGHHVAEEVRHALLHDIKGLDTVLVHIDPCDHLGDDAHALVAHHGAAPTTSGPVMGR